MATTIVVRGETATIDSEFDRGWFWTGTSSLLTAYLNDHLPEGGPSGADPDPLHHEAMRMAKLLDGRITETEDLTPEFVPGRVY